MGEADGGAGDGMKKPKLTSQRKRTAEFVAGLLREDPIFREKFIGSLGLSEPVASILNLLLELGAPTPPSVHPGPAPK